MAVDNSGDAVDGDDADNKAAIVGRAANAGSYIANVVTLFDTAADAGANDNSPLALPNTSVVVEDADDNPVLSFVDDDDDGNNVQADELENGLVERNDNSLFALLVL